MAEFSDDLWPSVFTTTYDDPAPVVILKQQAELLAKKTQGAVVGVVQDMTSSNRVNYSLYLKAPSLGEYMFKILTIGMSLALPHEAPFPLDADCTFEDQRKVVGDLDEFKEWLRSVLNSDGVKAVVGNMLRRSEGRTRS